MKKAVVMLTLVLSLAFTGCGSEAGEHARKTAEAVEENGQGTEEDKEDMIMSVHTEERSMAKAGEKGKGTEEKGTAVKGKSTEETAEKGKSTEEKGAAEKSKEDKEAEKPKLSDYTITVFEGEKAMYASGAVNVRKGPSTDFERIGGLKSGQEVTATGQADNGWYEIFYGEEKAYVSGKYLQDEKPAEPAPVPTPENQPQEIAAAQAVTEVKNVSGVILVGDSRFVQMQANVGENSCTWIAESGKGYNWFNENAIARIDGCVGKGSKILINLGVNDPGNLNNYLELVNAKAAEWVGKGAKVYYASVNPVWDNPYVTEEQVQYFNSQMQNGLSGDVQWIDSHSYLNTIGYKLVDGLHFNAETYQNLYAYYMSCL